MPFYTAAQAAAANSVAGGAPPTPLGPTATLRVVGIAATEFDFPSGDTPSYELFATPRFARTVVRHTATNVEYAVRLRHGSADLGRFNTEVDTLGHGAVQGIGNNNGLVQSIEGSIRPQAVGWWILAALTALVGLAVVGQALARQSVVESEDVPTLVALGADRRQLIMLGTARNLLVGAVGAVGAVVLSTALSPLTPVGEARLAESTTGIAIDTSVALLGALITMLTVLALGIWPSTRAARAARPGSRAASARPPALIARLADLGAPPSTLIGVGNALQRSGAGAGIPVGTALLGTVLAVVALCGTVVFGASLSHLTASPPLYGDEYQLSFDVVPGLPDPGLIGNLEGNRSVTAITRDLATQVSIDKATVGAVAVDALRGPLLLSTASGHLPMGDGQIALGAATMRQVHAHVGSVVSVGLTTPSGSKRTERFRVVSQVPLPVLDGYVGLGNGAVLTIPGYEAALCPRGPAQVGCRQAVEGSDVGALLTRTTSDRRGAVTVRRLMNANKSVATLPVTPTSLVNFGEAINFPLIFGAILAVFGAATLAHLLVVSVARRRRETGLLKVLGFLNHQVVSIVSWQATTVALVGIIVGVPLGVVVGRAIWNLFAGQIGVIPDAVVPIWLIVAMAAGVVLAANLIAIGPALVAVRTKPGRLLRTP